MGFGNENYPRKVINSVNSEITKELLKSILYNDLKLTNLDNLKVLITESVMAANAKKTREKLSTILFDDFGIESLNFSSQPILALYSQGLVTGLVVDIGDSVTQIVPIFDGFILSHLVRRVEIGGRHVTKQLGSLLRHSGYDDVKNEDILRSLKEEYCFTSGKLEIDKQITRETTIYSINKKIGRTTVKIEGERFMAPEVIFNPSLMDQEFPGLAEQIFDCIQSADIDLRSEFYKHVILSGGGSLISGLSKRLQIELQNLYQERILKIPISPIIQSPSLSTKDGMEERETGMGMETKGTISDRMKRIKIKIRAPQDRDYLIWQGGAILADLMKDKTSFWLDRDEWFQRSNVGILDKFSQLKI